MQSAKSQKGTRKCKKNLTPEDRAHLWNLFDCMKTDNENVAPLVDLTASLNGPKPHTNCDICQAPLMRGIENLLTCTNPKCCVMYTRENIDDGAEWRHYGADDANGDDPTRCGMPINELFPQTSLSCIVLGTKKSYEMQSIGRYTNWLSAPHKEKVLYNETQYMTHMCSVGNLSKMIIDEALACYKTLTEYEQTFRGANKIGLMIGATSIACRKCGFPRSAKELSDIYHVDISVTTNGIKLAQQILQDMEKNAPEEEKTVLCKFLPRDFIERYCSRLEMSKKLTKLCEFVAIKVQKEEIISENKPDSIAAGVVYFVAHICHLNVTKEDVAEISKVSVATIGKCNKKLEGYTLQLIPRVIVAEYGVDV